MIQKINDTDKFICNVYSITGNILREVEFDSLEEACAYKEKMEKLKNVKEVGIVTVNNTPINACDDEVEEEEAVEIKFENPVEETKELEEEIEEEEDTDEDEEKICCICGNEFTGWGNNPAPIKKHGECCDECNQKYVLQARILKSYKPHKTNLFITCENCGMPVVLSNDENVCDCGKIYTDEGVELIKFVDSSAKRVYAKTNKMNDARGYLSEFIEEYYERYRGITVFKKKLNNVDYEFVGEFLEQEYKDKTIEGLEAKLDKAIEKYVNTYAKDFEKKELK